MTGHEMTDWLKNVNYKNGYLAWLRVVQRLFIIIKGKASFVRALKNVKRTSVCKKNLAVKASFSGSITGARSTTF